MCFWCVLGQLKANNPELMEQAVTALQNLAHQCSDPSAVQDLVKHLFGILGGQWMLSGLQRSWHFKMTISVTFKLYLSMSKIMYNDNHFNILIIRFETRHT